MADTSMRVDDDTLDRLHDRKQRGESYNDVVVRLLNSTEPAATAQN